MNTGSVTPVAIDFVDVDFAAGEIVVGGELESAGGAVEGERGGFAGIVGVVGGETDLLVRFAGIEEEEGVVDAERGEADDVDDGRAVVLEVGKELFGHALLEATAEGHHDAPMAALEIALPRSAALRLEQRAPGGAEAVEIGIAGDDDFFGFRGEFGGVGSSDATNQFAVGGGVGDGQGGVEPGVLEELLGGAGDDEAMMGIFGRGVAGMADPLAVFVVVIFPDEFIGEGERVGLEVKGAAVGGGRLMRCGAAGGEQETKGREAKLVFVYQGRRTAHSFPARKLTAAGETDNARRAGVE